MMTSSVAASTGIFIPNASETPEKGTKSRGIEDETAGVPITDKQTATQPDTVPVVVHKPTPVSIEKWKKPPNLNSNSKIPHPLAALLATKASPFRRSHSVRMRGSKSSSLFKTFSQENYCHSCCNQSNNKVHTPYPHTASQQRRRACNAMEFACGANTRTAANNNTTLPSPNDEATSADQVTHELLAAGSVSPRRRLVLNSQTNVAPASPRSLSLSRSQNLSQNSNSKTAASTEACNAEESQKVATVPQHNGCVVDRKEEISSSSLSADLSSGNASSSTCKGRPDGHGSPLCQGDPGMREEQQNKMSLNPNGPQTTGTNARPTTLAPATATGAAATATKTVTKSAAPKTPKTPTSRGSQGQQQVSSPHNCGNQNCSSSKLQHQVQSQTLPTVPEAFKPTPRTPPVTPDSPSNYIQDDIDSLYSFATTTSGRSTMSCEHPYVACNGTTFSGRKMKYVVHCSNYAGQVGPDYLTPTQRAQRQIRRLKELLSVARQDLEEKDSEILRLTREVVELRLFKASLSSPEERSASSDAVTVREAELKTSQDVSPIVDMVDDATKTSPRHLAIHHHHQQQHALHLSTSEMQSSFADSGHFEDMTSSSVHSKDSYATGRSHEMACSRNTPAAGGADGLDDDEDEGADEARNADSYEYQRQKLIRMYEQRIEELIRTQDSASSEIKRSHNDKVEALLQKLAECNTRYADIVPDYEHAKERIRELEKQLEDLQRKLAEHDEKQNKMYLHMYQKGQEAERIARADQALELAHRSPNNKVSINQLLHQLQSTQDELENIRTIYRRLLDAQKNRSHVDPEVTLQFLKSAIYYFLTDKENSQGHLQAIESILEFTEAEKQNISKARSPK